MNHEPMKSRLYSPLRMTAAAVLSVEDDTTTMANRRTAIGSLNDSLRDVMTRTSPIEIRVSRTFAPV